MKLKLMSPNRYRIAPPQVNIKGECRLYLVGVGLAALYSTVFLSRYFNARADLYQWVGREKILIPGAVMEPFAALAQGAFSGFMILALCMTQFLLWHYMTYYTGAKSIYWMRRIPDATLLHRQCWTLPLIGAALSGVFALAFRGLYYLLYFFQTPAVCLPIM